MKKTILILLCSLLSLTVFGQTEKIISEIRGNFKNWQPIIESEIKGSTQLFHYAWGENYQEEEWYSNELGTKDKFLFQKATVIENSNLGTLVYYDNYAISGDWYIAVDFYFDTNNKLYFVFWRMNTFQASEPLTIEKRLYFNPQGEMIRNLKSTYKMNTKEESTSGFADREVEYELQLDKMDFYNKWKAN
ncbi:hypothetical protein [Reichenbachiella sp.]|uniref:hypothetical protein n=1 Tax=Reichenbachiella sp. TaxID=2184521 RepID=UPI003BB1720C